MVLVAIGWSDEGVETVQVDGTSVALFAELLIVRLEWPTSEHLLSLGQDR